MTIVFTFLSRLQAILKLGNGPRAFLFLTDEKIITKMSRANVLNGIRHNIQLVMTHSLAYSEQTFSSFCLECVGAVLLLLLL